MRIGVPKEIKVHEYRVGLTPASVRELTSRGHEVVVQALPVNQLVSLMSSIVPLARRSWRMPRMCSHMPT